MFTSQENSFYLPTSPINSYACQYEVNQYNDALFSINGIDLPQQISKAPVKRKAEFLAGRLCAHKSLEKIGHGNHSVDIGHNRCPVWPQGVVGSISHTKSTAISMVSCDTHTTGLGVDIENIMCPDIANKIYTQIIDNTEYALYLSEFRQKLEFTLFLTIIFSAKECLFKALYPRVNRYFGFSSARLVNIFQSSVELVITEDLCEKCSKAPYHTLHYQLKKDMVLVWISIHDT